MAAVKKLLVVFAICCLFVAFVAASGDDDDDDDDDVTVAPPQVEWRVGASLVMVDKFEIDMHPLAIYCVYEKGNGKIRLKLNSNGPVQKVVNNVCVRCFDCNAWGMHCEEHPDIAPCL